MLYDLPIFSKSSWCTPTVWLKTFSESDDINTKFSWKFVHPQKGTIYPYFHPIFIKYFIHALIRNHYAQRGHIEWKQTLKEWPEELFCCGGDIEMQMTTKSCSLVTFFALTSFTGLLFMIFPKHITGGMVWSF